MGKERICRTCGTPEAPNVSLGGGRRQCKSCWNVYMKKRRDAIKREYIAYLGGKCLDCNLQDSCIDIFDFHHRDPAEKDFNIGHRRGINLESLRAELDKCDLLCANCHRRRHAIP